MSDSLADPSLRPTWYQGMYGCREDMYAASIVLPIVADRDLLARQVEAVKALHRPCSPIFSWKDGLTLLEPCEECHGKAGIHPCGCWSQTDVEYECRECISTPTGKSRPVQPYPCPTIRALEGES